MQFLSDLLDGDLFKNFFSFIFYIFLVFIHDFIIQFYIDFTRVVANSNTASDDVKYYVTHILLYRRTCMHDQKMIIESGLLFGTTCILF